VSEGIITLAHYRPNKDREEYQSFFSYIGFDGTVERFGEEVTEPVRNLYLREFSYITSMMDITSNGNIGYVLMMEREPWIGKVQRGSSAMERIDIPEEFRNIPASVFEPEEDESLPGMDRMYLFYKEVAKSRMPVGVFSWKGDLFLLAKDAPVREIQTKLSMHHEETTPWFLIKVETHPDGSGNPGSQDTPSGERPATWARLPTGASQIILAQGEYLGILEKGPIRKIGAPRNYKLFRDTLAIKLVPAEVFTEESHPRFATKRAFQCIRLYH
jgi:hypothetical protein